ncbi:NUDIX hydrolase [Neptunitalea chrysea]|nr:NUDIX domain-containing protein [Neptunitalea chrysea]
MENEENEKELQESHYLESNFLPHIALDCVVFGFDSEQLQLKVLMLKMKHREDWGLPGGFVGKRENLEDAAIRVLKERTGAKDIYLKQFKTFGKANRTDEIIEGNTNVLWLKRRFITVGFYALVDYKQVKPNKDKLSSDCGWKDIKDLPAIMLDHQTIFEEGLESLRRSLMLRPVGYGLLPEKFTLSELQNLYEIILDRKLNRGNFYRKVMKYQILEKLNEIRNIGAHKAPFLYRFNKERYDDAVTNGLKDIW